MIKWVILTIPKNMHRHHTTYSHASALLPHSSLSLPLNNKIMVIPHTLLSPLALAPLPTPTLHIDKDEDVWPNGQKFSSGRKGHPKQGRSTYWVCWNRRLSLPWHFWEGAIFCCKVVHFDGGSQCYPTRRRDRASSVDSPLLKSISKASCCLLYGWRVNWCDWPKNVAKIHVAIYLCCGWSWACCGKH